jgi:hypothetical protein
VDSDVPELYLASGGRVEISFRCAAQKGIPACFIEQKRANIGWRKPTLDRKILPAGIVNTFQSTYPDILVFSPRTAESNNTSSRYTPNSRTELFCTLVPFRAIPRSGRISSSLGISTWKVLSELISLALPKVNLKLPSNSAGLSNHKPRSKT